MTTFAKAARVSALDDARAQATLNAETITKQSAEIVRLRGVIAQWERQQKPTLHRLASALDLARDVADYMGPKADADGDGANANREFTMLNAARRLLGEVL